jgi:hypothetical protein
MQLEGSGEQPGALPADESLHVPLHLFGGDELGFGEQPGALSTQLSLHDFVRSGVVFGDEQPGALSASALLALFPSVRELLWFLVRSPMRDHLRILSSVEALRIVIGSQSASFMQHYLQPHACFDCIMFVVLTLMMGILGHMGFMICTPPPAPVFYGQEELEGDWVEELIAYFTVMSRCRTVPHKVGRWIHGTKLVVAVQPALDWGQTLRHLRSLRRRGRTEPVSDPRFFQYIKCISFMCLAGACLGIAIILWHPNSGLQPGTTGCPMLALAQHVGTILLFATRAVGLVGWQYGRLLFIASTTALQAAPGLVTGVTRTVATLMIALVHALRPALEVCHPEGILSMSPAGYAAICSTVQPLLWTAVRAHAQLAARIIGSDLPFLKHTLIMWVWRGATMLAYPPPTSLHGNALHALHASAPVRTSTAEWPILHRVPSGPSILQCAAAVGLCAAALMGVGTHQTRGRPMPPGTSGIFRPCLVVAYTACMLIASYLCCPDVSLLATAPMLCCFQALAWIAGLTMVTGLFSMASCPVTWQAYLSYLSRLLLSVRFQLQVFSLMAVAVTAELAVRPDQIESS